MKLMFILFVFFYLIGCATSHNLKIDILKKYSYLLVTTDSDYMENFIGKAGGTGFILSYKKKNYLVTNYHVLSGRDALTNIQTNSLFTPKNVTVFFHIRKSNNLFPLEFRLYDSLNIPLYYTIQLTIGNYLDVAILPMPILQDSIEQNIIKERSFDTSNWELSDRKLIIAGFPEGRSDSNNYAIILNSVLVIQPHKERVIYPYVFYYSDSIIQGGTSGSPIYMVNNKKDIKLIAINYKRFNLGDEGLNATGGGLLLKYVFMAIDKYQ